MSKSQSLLNAFKNVVDVASTTLQDGQDDQDERAYVQSFITTLTEIYGLEDTTKVVNTETEPVLKATSGIKLEPLLDPKNQKFTAFPIKYHDIWKMYKDQMSLMWKAEEIDFSKDYDDYMTLNDDEKHFVEMILAFFAASDGIVNFNLGERFAREITITEAQFAYQFQMMMENIHSEVYSLMLDNIVRDPAKKEHLFKAIETVPAVKMMADWAFKWIDSTESFAHRVVAFTIVEGVFFSGAFAAIFWLKKYKNKSSNANGRPFMNGLVKSNKFIARDEGLHCSFGALLYKHLQNKLSAETINTIMKEAVEISKVFITDAIPVRLIGMNSDMMSDYIEYIADRLLSMLNHKKIYNKQNPFKFMESIGLDGKTNLHESRPDEYSDAYVLNSFAGQSVVISDDF